MRDIDSLIRTITADGVVTREQWEEQLGPQMDEMDKRASKGSRALLDLWGDQTVRWEGPDGLERPDTFHRTGATFNSLCDRLRTFGYPANAPPFGTPSSDSVRHVRAGNITESDEEFERLCNIVGRQEAEVSVGALAHGFNLNHPGLAGRIKQAPDVDPGVHGVAFAGSSGVDRPDFWQVGNHMAGLVSAGSTRIKCLPLRTGVALSGEEWASAIDFAAQRGVELINLTWSVGITGDAVSEIAAAIERHPEVVFVVSGYSLYNQPGRDALVRHHANNMIAVDGIGGASGPPLKPFGKEHVHLVACARDLFSCASGEIRRLHDTTWGAYMSQTGPCHATSVASNVAAKCLVLHGALSPLELRRILVATADDHPDWREHVASAGPMNPTRAMQCSAALRLVADGGSVDEALDRLGVTDIGERSRLANVIGLVS